MEAEGLTADLYVTGGGAMLLNGIPRSLTDDLDARARGENIPRVLELAREIGRERGIREDWLSGGSEPYIPPDPEHDHVEQIGAIRVRPASNEVLLAMKLVADRIKDSDDIQRLIRDLGIRSSEELVHLAKDIYGEERLEYGLGYGVLEEIELRAPGHVANAWRDQDPPASLSTQPRPGPHGPQGRVGKGVPEGGRFTERQRGEPQDLNLENTSDNEEDNQ